MKVCIVVGTRPEIIKMSSLMRLCRSEKIDYFTIHSNQHYSSNMDDIFFNELGLEAPKYNLNVGSGTHSNQTGNILIKIGPILEKENPDYVLVQGDTNTVLAAALAGTKLNQKVAHIEAGLRSYDRMMPEETNRVTTDHLADFLFAVTKTQSDILLKESIDQDKIFVVGNTVVDAVYGNIKNAHQKSRILQDLNITPKDFVLVTAHRSSNVDHKESFIKLLDIINEISSFEEIVWPIHPRAKKNLKAFKLDVSKRVRLIDPVGFNDFLVLEEQAKIILTDSGGVQEEACVLGTPCITLRENTERPETLDVGANKLVGLDKEKALRAYKDWNNKENYQWENPFGDGTSAQKILKILKEDFYGKESPKLKESICVIGLGYMGLPMSCLLSDAGYQVRGVDINLNKTKSINEGVVPFNEKGMNELLQKALSKGFKASTTVEPSDVFIISVPTPEKNKKCDLSYVIAACESLTEVLQDGNLVIIESTIRPKTCEYLKEHIFNKVSKEILIAHCPERAIPGNTLNELLYNDRLVGGLDERSTQKAFQIYSHFSKGHIFKTSATTAECVKLMENTFRDVNIALANEFDNVLADYNVSSFEAITLANKHPRVNILYPGPGVGGHCIAIDPWFLLEGTNKSQLIPMAREINDNRPLHYSQKIQNLCKEKNINKVGVLGIAYKKNVDDARETPTFTLMKDLEKTSLTVKVNDPHVPIWHYPVTQLSELLRWAEIIILMTDHDEYKDIKLATDIILIDTRNLLMSSH